MNDVKIAAVPHVRKMDALNENELELLVSYIPKKKHQLMARFIAATGARREEFINIRISDINFKTEEVYLWKCKGGKEGKEKDRVTIIYNDKHLVKDIKEYLKSRNIKDKRKEPLFSATKNDFYKSGTSINTVIKKAGSDVRKRLETAD